LLIKSLRAERETKPPGVTRQLQQEIICSSGEKVYTFTQMLSFATAAQLAPPPSTTTGTLAPVSIWIALEKRAELMVWWRSFLDGRWTVQHHLNHGFITHPGIDHQVKEMPGRLLSLCVR
jgi:hypothetical protein